MKVVLLISGVLFSHENSISIARVFFSEENNDQEETEIVPNSMELEMLQDGNSIFWSWSGGPSNSDNKKIELNIDLNDPDVADAVTKIQAGFRASQARKLAEEAKSKTSHNGSQCFKNPNKLQFIGSCTISYLFLGYLELIQIKFFSQN